MRAVLLLVLVALLPIACTSGTASKPTAARDHDVRLIFTGDLWGQLEPCGCSADMRGGLDRAASWIQRQREAGPLLLVDAGDAFYDRVEYPEVEQFQVKRRATAVAEALLAMGIDAKASFERDRTYPVAAFPRRKLLQSPTVLEVDGLQVGFVPVDATGGNPSKALVEGVRAVKARGAVVAVALVHGPRQETIQLAAVAKAAGVDFVVGSHIANIAEGDQARAIRADVPIFFTQARGQSLLQIDLAIRPGGGPVVLSGNEGEREAELASLEERIRSYEQRLAGLPEGVDPNPFRQKRDELKQRRLGLSEGKAEPPTSGSHFTYRFVPVTEDLASNPEVKAIIAAYDRDVAEANLAWAKAHPAACPEAAPGEATYVGGATCAGCHQAADGFWKTTRHAQAYETLEKINKQYDLECIGCHVTGWEQPGGACNVAEVEGRKDVTCESCHGPGSLHVQAPTQAKLPRHVGEANCLSCHTPENSLDFDYATYLKKIIGPGHGAPPQK